MKHMQTSTLHYYLKDTELRVLLLANQFLIPKRTNKRIDAFEETQIILLYGGNLTEVQQTLFFSTGCFSETYLQFLYNQNIFLQRS